MKITEDQIQFIKNNYPEKGALFCAKHLQIKPEKVRSIANNKLKLKISKELWSHYRRKENRKPKEFTEYNVNPQQFLDIQTPEVAYILGLLWADGHLAINKPKNPKWNFITYLCL